MHNSTTIFLVNKKEIIIDAEDWSRVKKLNWQLDSSGRAGHMVRKKGFPRKYISLHRFIDNTPEGIEIDHINRNKRDNRKINLRRCTRAQNEQNKPNRTGRFKGVWFNKSKGKYEASIVVEGSRKHIGTFRCEVQAAKKYNVFARRYHKEFCYLNKIPKDVMYE